MKKAFAITLILAFLFNLTGCFVILNIQHYRVRREMVRNIENGIFVSNSTSITIAPKDRGALTWEGENEFRYRGMWYDVVKKERLTYHSIVYHCIADHRDTNLFSEMASLIRKQQNDSEKGKIPLKHVNKIQTFCPSPFEDMAGLPFGESQKHAFSYLLLYSSLKLQRENPPPQNG